MIGVQGSIRSGRGLAPPVCAVMPSGEEGHCTGRGWSVHCCQQFYRTEELFSGRAVQQDRRGMQLCIPILPVAPLPNLVRVPVLVRLTRVRPRASSCMLLRLVCVQGGRLCQVYLLRQLPALVRALPDHPFCTHSHNPAALITVFHRVTHMLTCDAADVYVCEDAF
jgi:hypothetical protein